MSKVNWSKDQLDAINIRNKNILVSAAAGAGKTSVLVERIRKMISEDKIPVKEFLVVTFTNDAAAEMRERLRVSLTKELKAKGYDGEDSAFQRKQLIDLDSAYINTFHSFGLKVIRRFFYKLDIEPGFSISEPADAEILMEAALDIIFEREFSEGREDFLSFMDSYSGLRDDSYVRDLMSEVFTKLSTMPHSYEWMEEKIRDIETAGESFSDSFIWKLIKRDIEEKLDSILFSLYSAIKILESRGLDYLAELLEKNEFERYTSARELMDEIGDDIQETLDEIKALLTEKNSTLKVEKEDKETYEEIKDLVSDYRDKAKSISKDGILKPYLSAEMDVLVEQSLMTVPHLRTLRRLVMDLGEVYSSLKRDRGVLDFNDIEHYCYMALEDPEVAEYYRNAISHIFIDEYQDTNLMQEAIIERIKRSDNLFMVGDIKQSIYRFRLAEPSIFQEKYREYSKEEDDSSIVINLNENHRSKSEIIGAVNKVFERIMDDYDENARLRCCIDSEPEFVFKPELKVIISPDDEDDELNLGVMEMEANVVADIILDNLGKPYLDCSSNPPVERPLKLSDMVILMRSVKGTAYTYSRVLKEKGIESFIDGDEGYFDTVEIQEFLDLLRVIDNVRQDIPLVGVLHQETFGFTPSELAEIRIGNREGGFSDSFLNLYKEAKEKGEDLTPLEEKVTAAYDRIKNWQEMSRTMSLPTFIWELLLDSGIFSVMGAFPGGGERQANLKVLCTMAENLGERGKNTIFDFLQYVDSVDDSNISVFSSNEAKKGEGIRITTIHKSKGLEYPMVILGRLGARIVSRTKEKFLMHKDVGVGLDLIDRKRGWRTKTLMEYLIKGVVDKESLDEEIRILYVAMTRAKDKLFMLATPGNDKFDNTASLGIIDQTRFLGMLAPILPYSVKDFELTDRYLSEDESDYVTFSTDQDEIIERLEFKYPDNGRMLKSKYSATELNQAEWKKGYGRRNQSLRTDDSQEERHFSAAERGTIYHSVLEKLSFKEMDGLSPEEISKKVDERCEHLVSKGVLSAEEVNAISKDRFRQFFLSDLGKRCINADKLGQLEKERPFTLKIDKGGEKVLVQGIIDCYFTEIEGGETKTVLIDYKSNRIYEEMPIEAEEERLREAYSTQMAIYKQALEVAGMCNVCEVYLYLLDIGHYFLI